MASQHLQIKTKTGFSVAVEYLESLIECLKRGTIFLAHDGKSILLKPRTPISMDLEAEAKPDHAISKEKIVLKLQWEIRETWPRGEEIFSIAGPDLADGEHRDPPLSPRKSGGAERGAFENQPDAGDTRKDKASPEAIRKKAARRGAKQSKLFVRKKP